MRRFTCRFQRLCFLLISFSNSDDVLCVRTSFDLEELVLINIDLVLMDVDSFTGYGVKSDRIILSDNNKLSLSMIHLNENLDCFVLGLVEVPFYFFV